MTYLNTHHPKTNRNARPQVAVHGAYFANNFGDTLLIGIVCDWVADQVGRQNVFLAMPGNATEQAFLGYPVVRPEQRGNITHLIYGGGGYFGEPNFGLLKRFRWQRRNRTSHLGWLSSYSQAKKAVIGVGVGPITFSPYRRAIERLFCEADPIYVRDAESLAYCKQNGLNGERVRLGTDLALSIPSAAAAPEKLFAIHLTGLRPREIVAVFQALVQSGLTDENRTIDVIFDGAAAKKTIDRYERALTLSRALGRLNFIDYKNVEALTHEIGEHELIVTSKLHVGIVATALGRKVISIPVHQKTVRFYRQLGLEEFCLEGPRRNVAEIVRMISLRRKYQFDRNVIDRILLEMRDGINKFLS